ncbi:MAG: (2Fe-2S)-binding protein [Firmicutes bacterium]|nr:(2Fe-2S)-binding protein [Bacillota bacterium]
MTQNHIVCNCMQVDYLAIRRAMISGARAQDDIQNVTKASTVCGRCKDEIGEILASVCGCKNVSLAEVAGAVKNGADTAEKVGEATGAGTVCGRCKPLVQNVIDIGR